MKYLIGFLKNVIFRPHMVIKNLLILAFLIVIYPFDLLINYLYRRKLIRELKDIIGKD